MGDTSGLTEIETRWVAYARTVVDASDHDRGCSLGRRTTPEGNDGGGERWPGYLGAGYRTGGLVCGGKVHTRFASAGLAARSELVEQAVAATGAWRLGRITDERWLTATRNLYSAGLTDGGWRVGTHFRRAIDLLGESADSIAWVNAARCQWQGSAPSGFARPCLSRFPWGEVIEVLRPRLVLTTEEGVALQVRDLAPVLHFHQLNGLSWSETTATRPDGTVVRLPTKVRSTDWANWLVEMGFNRE